ncbi:MAG TPA: FAD-dependent oxidoreductase, partial [Phycisphaerae bacterium]|nr:FAD-dependent oxidoreductase [Phycisphaerae bacterium]
MPTTYLQRRYLVNFQTSRLSHVFTDVLVIGAGLAGLRSALAAAENADVIILSKGDTQSSNSYKAQGGMAAAIAKYDSIEKHVTDTLATALGLGDEEVIQKVISDAPQQVRQMLDWGVGFDTDGGQLALGREGGHSENRIVHANGDSTGKALVDVLAARVEADERIKMWQDCHVLDLVTDPPEGGVGCRCLGALTYHKRFGLQLI